MLTSFLRFPELLKSNNIKIINSKLHISISNYLFLHISSPFNFYQNKQIMKNIKESNAIIINKYEENFQSKTNYYFIIAFKKTIIIINQISIPIISNLFSINTDINIIFLPNIKDIFNQYIQIPNTQNEFNKKLLNEITDFCQELKLKHETEKVLKVIWNSIQFCIAGFLINECYAKLNKKVFSFSNDSSTEEINEYDYIVLRSIGAGSSFRTELIYHIEKESLYVIIKPLLQNDETMKLLKRETKNYQTLNYPFIPKLYGTVKGTNYPIIEFINGNTLLDIEKLHLEYNEKITIIFKLMRAARKKTG